MSSKIKTITTGGLYVLLHLAVFAPGVYHATTWYFDYPFSSTISMFLLLGTEALVLAECFILNKLIVRRLFQQNFIKLLTVLDAVLLIFRVGFYLLLLYIRTTKVADANYKWYNTDLKNGIGSFVAWVLPAQLVLSKLRILHNMGYGGKKTVWMKWQSVLSFVPIVNWFLFPGNLIYYCKENSCRGLLKKLIFAALSTGIFCIVLTLVVTCLTMLKMYLTGVMSLPDGIVLIVAIAMILYGMPLFLDLRLIDVQYEYFRKD